MSDFETPVQSALHKKKHSNPNCSIPIGSMYGIFTYFWLIFMVNVGKYPSPMDPMALVFHDLILQSTPQSHKFFVTDQLLVLSHLKKKSFSLDNPKGKGMIYHLESRWRNSHVLVYHGPLLSHLLGVAPSTFTTVYIFWKRIQDKKKHSETLSGNPRNIHWCRRSWYQATLVRLASWRICSDCLHPRITTPPPQFFPKK